MITESIAKVPDMHDQICQGAIYRNVRYNYIESEDDESVNVIEYEFPLAIIVSYFARRNNKPYIVQAHGSVLPFFQKEGLKNLFDKAFGFRILHNASCVFALTEVEKEQYLKMGVDEEKIEIVPLGINLEEYENLPEYGKFKSKFHIDNDDKLILFIGRLHEIKGLDLLIEAFDDLVKNEDDGYADNIKLAIVGPDDGYLSILEEKIRESSIEDNVIVAGPLYKEEKQEALVDCDLFVMPSRYESFTTSGLEAMACSKPLVLTKNNHIHDWVDGNVGIACDDNKDSLRKAIEKLLFDEDLASVYGENGRKLIEEKYNWDIINEQILEIYKKFL